MGFISLQLVAAYGLERWWMRFRDPQFAFKNEQLRNLVAESPKRPLVVAIGSSRFLMGLDSDLLNGAEGIGGCTVYNLGIEGDGPIMNRIQARRLGEAAIRPEILLVDLIPVQLLASDEYAMEDSHLDGSRLRLDELGVAVDGSVQYEPMLRRWLIARALPCRRYGERLRRELSIDRRLDGLPVDDARFGIGRYGFRPHPGQLSPEKMLEKKVAALNCYRPQFQNAHLSPVKQQALRHLLKESSENGIRVVLIMMPEASSFRDLYPSGLEGELAQMLRELRQEFGLVATVDARKWVADGHFVDPHHLDMHGARIFTERLMAETLLPIKGNWPPGAGEAAKN